MQYQRIDREPTYRNPAKARNIAYRLAQGKIIIAQSDDVEHRGDAVEILVQELQPRQFVLANVFNVDLNGIPTACHGNWIELIGPNGRARRPLFFLGALWRKDLYTIGGCDEEFVATSREDVWFSDCLIHGLGLQPYFSTQAVGHHLDHSRPKNLAELTAPSRELYQRKRRAGLYTVASGLTKYLH